MKIGTYAIYRCAEIGQGAIQPIATGIFAGTLTLMPLPMQPINVSHRKTSCDDRTWPVAFELESEYWRQYRWMSGFRLELEPDPSYARYSLHSDSLSPGQLKLAIN